LAEAAGLAVVLALGVLGVNSAINGWLSLKLDAQTASMLGRPGIYRIQDAYHLVPPEARADWLGALQARSDDPAVQAALPLLATVGNPWTGPRDALALEPALYGRHPDALMTAGFMAYLLWPHNSVWAQWRQEFNRALFGVRAWNGSVGQVGHLLLASAGSVESVFPSDPRAQAAAAATGTGAGNPATAAAYRALADPMYPVVDAYHQAILYGEVARVGALLLLLLLAFLLFALGRWMLRRLESDIRDLA